MKIRNAIAQGLVIIFFLSVCPALNAQNAIDFSLKDLNGETVRLKDFVGEHVILINFWATWCVPCVKELPHFQKYHDEYKNKGLKVITITVDGPETVALVRPFMNRYKYSFPVLLDIESRVIALYNPSVLLPYTVLIDKQGRIRHGHQGYSPGDENVIEEEILELLQEEKTEIVKKVSVSINESFLSRMFSDDDYVDTVRAGRSGQVINRLDMSLTAGDFILGARADTDLDFSPLDSEFSLAKRFVEYNHDYFNLRLGDFYYSMGRGLLFSVLKTFEKEGLEFIIDTTVDGGKASFHHKQFSVDIFGGRVNRELSDERDIVFGGMLGWRVKNFALFNLSYMGSRFEQGAIRADRNVDMQSVSLDIPNISKKVKFYGEFVLVQRDDYYSDDVTHGHGAYLESGLFFGNFTFLFEFKDYRNLGFDYNRPPMMESEELPVLANQFAKDADDITGFTGRIDYYFPTVAVLLWSKTAYFEDYGAGRPREILHFYGGVEKKFKQSGWLNVAAGYRREITDSLVYYYTQGDTYHYQFNLSYPFTSRFSLEVDLQGKEFKGAQMEYYERRSYLSLHYSQRWVFTFFYDQTSDPQVLFFKEKKHWFGAQLEIKLAANSIRLFYGAMKGGVKCSGGICKFFPPFEGLRLDATLRF